MKTLVEHLMKSTNIVLSTHRQADGDGLGSELALYYALKKVGRQVTCINVDEVPQKYNFLNKNNLIKNFEKESFLPEKIDIVVIFDTNDHRLLEPLYSAFKIKTDRIFFVDHHPVLKKGPQPTPFSFIDSSAASAGELTYRLIKALHIPLDQDIAECLYSSITFDTQLYRYIRSSSNSHLIAAELISHDINPERIHRCLFANQTVEKMAYLAKSLKEIEYFEDGQIAYLHLKDKDLYEYGLEPEDSRDLIDMIMNIESLEVAAIIREDLSGEHKISLRSKGQIEVLSVAEDIGGGGHIFSSGAYMEGKIVDIKNRILNGLKSQLKSLKYK